MLPVRAGANLCLLSASPYTHPWLYQKLACPFLQGAPGCVALTQPSPTALAEQPSVFASQLTSCASTAFLEVGNVMQPWPATVAMYSPNAHPTRSVIIVEPSPRSATVPWLTNSRSRSRSTGGPHARRPGCVAAGVSARASDLHVNLG